MSLKSEICKDTAPRTSLASYSHNAYEDRAREPLHLRSASATRWRSRAYRPAGDAATAAAAKDARKNPRPDPTAAARKSENEGEKS